MSPFVILVLLGQTLPLSPSGSHCFVTDDRTAGWKQAAVPKGAPALSAPEGTDQYRSGEPAWVERLPTAADFTSRKVSWGTVVYDFYLPAGAQRMKVRFAQRLDGMRVEVRGSGEWTAQVPLQTERRYAGHDLDLGWTATGVQQVTVILHHHLRPEPLVSEWSSALLRTMPEQTPKTLHWYQPAGAHVELCDAPGRTLAFHPENLP